MDNVHRGLTPAANTNVAARRLPTPPLPAGLKTVSSHTIHLEIRPQNLRALRASVVKSIPHRLRRFWRAQVAQRLRQPVEPQIHNRRGVQRQQLANHQAADDGHAQRTPQLGTSSRAERQRHCAKQRGECRHHDGTEAQQTRLVNRVHRRLAFLALRLQREVNHHDGVLLHDADQQDDADQGHHSQVHVK